MQEPKEVQRHVTMELVEPKGAVMMVDLSHSLGQHLASAGQAPAHIDDDGALVFMAGESLQAYATVLLDGRLELFAGVGYVSAETLQVIVQADEDCDFDEQEPRHVADVMARWTGEGAQWAVDVDRRTGLMTLSMFVPGIPGDPAEWGPTLDAFRRTADSWMARLHSDPPELMLPQAGAELVDVTSGEFLRC
ncbi:hypothetical protein GCM10023165_39240 [Variovorax defluvii]|uniref:Tir chaperone family protein CesT n=2 Tax=Variovorax defluvii TaxID=913761 RepID=A0ABP8I4I6_9BURK